MHHHTNSQATQSIFTTFLQGIIMGAFDIVPGVSGGTIAFILGIYERLINSIAAIHPRLFTLYKKQGLKSVWQTINGTFLLSLGTGILCSILSLAHVIHFLLNHYPQIISGFFLGLIAASAVVISKGLSWSKGSLCFLFLGILGGIIISTLSPIQGDTDLYYVFISGFIAICAMILPGISGSFILLLLGMYGYIIKSILAFNLLVILTFSSGCLIGLLCFTKVLKWLFKHCENFVLCLLTGIMIGSLYKIWPWKRTIEYAINRHGENIPVVEQNILPTSYQEIINKDPMTIWVVLLILVGFFIVIGLDLCSKNKRTQA